MAMIDLPLHTWLGLLFSLLLASLTLCLTSHLSPSQRPPLSLPDSTWCISSAIFLSLPHHKLQVTNTLHSI